jgi:hypothetical protein
MRCPADLGYTPWDGRILVLVAIDVAAAKHIIHGVAGAETVDTVRPGISAGVRESTMAARQMGIRFPSLEFTISLHSGSSLEIICDGIQVELESN